VRDIREQFDTLLKHTNEEPKLRTHAQKQQQTGHVERKKDRTGADTCTHTQTENPSVRYHQRRPFDQAAALLHALVGVRRLHKLLEQVALFEAFERVGRHQVEDLGRALDKERRRKLCARDFQK
jgi:hypothetical protein